MQALTTQQRTPGADPGICIKEVVPPIAYPSPLPSLFLPLEAGPINQLRAWGSAVSSPEGKTNLVHFKAVRIPLVAIILNIMSTRDVVLGTCTCTRVVLEYKSRVPVLVLVLEGWVLYLYLYLARGTCTCTRICTWRVSTCTCTRTCHLELQVLILSHGGLIITPHRSRMADKTLSSLVFLKCNTCFSCI